MIPVPRPTALRSTCILETPSPLINTAFLYAKNNLARCMRYYTLGWGMSNAPHWYTIVVGRDTGWMCLGTDYVAPWFSAEALKIFRNRQKPNGQILEYVDMETDDQADYGLNVADNTPFYLWAIHHHWQQYQDQAFLDAFLPSVRAAADYLLSEIRANGLVYSVPNGTGMYGCTTWRNIMEGAVIAGEVTEINALTARALEYASDLTGDFRYRESAQHIASAMNQILWQEETYALTRSEGVINPQVTGDTLFPLLAGMADSEQTQKVLARLQQPDFWTARGLRTVPNTDPAYHPNQGWGLTGGSWPNLTLWYATAIAPYDPDRALAALECVAEPVVQPSNPEQRLVQGEFAEFFDGDTGENKGMTLSPWVAPTFIWAVLEGLLGLTWTQGKAEFHPHFPTGWDVVKLRNVPSATGLQDYIVSK